MDTGEGGEGAHLIKTRKGDTYVLARAGRGARSRTRRGCAPRPGGGGGDWDWPLHDIAITNRV